MFLKLKFVQEYKSKYYHNKLQKKGFLFSLYWSSNTSFNVHVHFVSLSFFLTVKKWKLFSFYELLIKLTGKEKFFYDLILKILHFHLENNVHFLSFSNCCDITYKNEQSQLCVFYILLFSRFLLYIQVSFLSSVTPYINLLLANEAG